MEDKDQLAARRDAWRAYAFRSLEVVLLLAFLSCLSWLFIVTLNYTLPFVLAIFIAIFLHPLVKALERLHLSRIVAVTIAMVGSLAIIIGLLSYGLVRVVQETTALASNMNFYFSGIQDYVNQKIVEGQIFVGKMPPSVVAQIQSRLADVFHQIDLLATSLLNAILNWLIALPDELTILVMAIIAAFFYLLDKEKLIGFFRSLLPPTWDEKVSDVYGDISDAFAGLIRAQGILVVVTMILGTIGLLLLNIKYAVVLGLLLGISGLVPLLGSLIITIPWAIGAFVFGDVGVGIKVLVLQGIISAVRQIIEPKILADNVGLDTLSTLISLYIGYQAIGVLGLFFGPIFLIGLKSLLRARMFVDWVPNASNSRKK